jgi:hypothetical protein
MIQTDIGYGRGWLDAPAAASLRRVDAAIGRPLDVNSAGRTHEEQAEARRKYENGGPYAAPVGESPHEFGNAVDTDDRFISLMAEHGWSRPLSGEPWHFVYYPSRDNHINEGVPAATGGVSPATRTILKGTDMEFAVKATSDASIDGVEIRTGQHFAVSANAPMTIMSADEVSALDWFEGKDGATPDKVIGYRLHLWAGDRIRNLMRTRGYFPWALDTGRTDYTDIRF